MEYSNVKGYLEYWVRKEIQTIVKSAKVEIVSDANSDNNLRIHALYVKLPIGSEIKKTYLDIIYWRLQTRSCIELETRYLPTNEGLTIEIQFSCNMVNNIETKE